jgi:ribonuclease T2
MDRAWVGHFSDTNGFRDHEWSKHGTCFRGEVINSNGDQDNYFKTVLNLWEMYDLYKGLAMVNVRPSNT